MNAFEFAGKHPILTFLLSEIVVVNACKLINNIAAYKMLGTEAVDIREKNVGIAEELSEIE